MDKDNENGPFGAKNKINLSVDRKLGYHNKLS